MPLPSRLQSRLEESSQANAQADAQSRQDAAKSKRAEHIRSVRAKAAEANDKIAAAQARRMLSAGDDFHYTVVVDEDQGMVQQTQGWGKKQVASFLPSSLRTTKLVPSKKVTHSKLTPKLQRQMHAAQRSGSQGTEGFDHKGESRGSSLS